jgi:DnaJ-domain-containing protein 1
MAVWNRGRRTEGDSSSNDEDDEEFVSLSDADHAWWAGREDLQRAWAPKERVDAEEPTRTSAFEKQFSAESLFDWAEGTDTFTSGERDQPIDPRDPFAVLGVPPTSTWEEIVAAHRQLAKTHHPDRLQDADPEQREASEHTMRTVNAAYRELQARYRPS